MLQSALPVQRHLESEAETATLAQAFAQHMQPADVVLLSGDLAAGKTFFVRAAVAALGSEDAVSSPTYTLAHVYNGPNGPIVHMDAYRLKTPADFADLALEDEFEFGFGFIEWGEMLAGEFENFVMLDLAQVPASPQARCATLTSQGPRGAALLLEVARAFPA